MQIYFDIEYIWINRVANNWATHIYNKDLFL